MSEEQTKGDLKVESEKQMLLHNMNRFNLQHITFNTIRKWKYTNIHIT